MGRPASDVEARMVKAGVELLTEGGFDAVDIRSVCKRAGANPGLFHYYFRTKAAFVDQAMAQAYEVFFEALNAAVASGRTPLKRLEEALVVLGLMAHRHRALLGSLTRGAKGQSLSKGVKVGRQLARFSAFFDALVEAAGFHKGREADRTFVHQALVESAIAAPLLWSALDDILGTGERPPRLSRESIAQNAFTHQSIRRRVRLALAGLKP